MITSTSNARIKNISNLKKSSRARKEQSCFLVEGPRMFFELPPGQIRELYLTEEFEKKYADRLKDYRYEVISDSVCRHLSDTKTPQGVIAVAEQLHCRLEDMLAHEEAPCLLLLENIQDPGNMGTILRSAEAAGITGVIVNQDTVDPYNPKVIRSTMGAVFRVPFLVARDFRAVIEELKKAGVCIYAAHLSGKMFYDYDYRQACAFLVGNEGKGLTDETAALADRQIRIPMKGRVESLNAAMASTVILYEVLRQRDWS